MKNYLDILLERRKNRKTRSKFPIESFIDKWSNSSNLSEKIHKKIHDRNLIQEARNQFIMSIITALEVFLRDSLLFLIDEYKLDYTKLAKKKADTYSLEKIEFITKNKITIGELIVDYCNFQNLGGINECFSLLFGFNLFEEVKQYKWVYDEKDPQGFMQVSNFYLIDRLLKLRHNITHDLDFKRKINKRDLDEMENELVTFANILSFFFEDLIEKKLKISKLLKFKR